MCLKVGGHDGPLVRKSVEKYNPETGKWSYVADMQTMRRNAGVVAVNGLMYVCGGDDSNQNLQSVEVCPFEEKTSGEEKIIPEG